jgi:hypothetical protein
MGRKVNFSNQEKHIDEIWSWYDDQKNAIRLYKNRILDSIHNQTAVSDKFLNITLDELNDYFEESERELEYLVCFNIFSATEAVLRINYLKKYIRKINRR